MKTTYTTALNNELSANSNMTCCYMWPKGRKGERVRITKREYLQIIKEDQLLRRKDALVKGMDMEQLVVAFESTEHMNGPDVFTVRGWLMDEIEKRNPEGFDKWLDGDDCYDSSLRKYVL